MKKSYVKPQVCFEDFHLSTSIAAGCEYTTNQAMNQCVYHLANDVGNVFVDANTNCHDITAPGGSYGSICYHVPADTNNLFTSA